MSDVMANKPRKLTQIKQDVLTIVQGAQRLGAVDMTAMEIQRIYEERVRNGRISDGYFAGRVSEMVADGQLLRSAKRQCRATLSLAVNTVRAPIAAPAISVPAADCY